MKIKVDKKKAKKALIGVLAGAGNLFAEIEGLDQTPARRTTHHRTHTEKTSATKIIIAETKTYIVHYGKTTRQFKSLAKAKKYARQLAKEKNALIIIHTTENA